MRKFLVVAALAAFATLLTGSKADAAIRLRVEDGGGNVRYFYDSNNQLDTGAFTIGAFSGAVDTVVTNFPGSPLVGTLGQTFNVTEVLSTGSTSVTLIASVIEQIGSFTNDGVTREITGGDIATLNAAALAFFTQPAGDSLLLTADVGAALNISNTSGSATVTSTAQQGTANEESTTSGPRSLVNGAAAAPPTSTFFDRLPSGYTLVQTLAISGVNVGASGFNVTGSTSVANVVPAPAGVLLLAAGAPLLGVLGLRRRKAAVKA